MNFARPDAEPADRVIISTRVFAAPRRLVFKAWTDPRHVALWWGPKGFTNPECDVDLRVGGTFRLKMQAPDGQLYPCQATFREVVEPERLVYTGTAEDCHPCGGGIPPRATVTVTFDEKGGHTTLTIRTELASSADREAAANAGYIVGWESCLERLSDFLATS